MSKCPCGADQIEGRCRMTGHVATACARMNPELREAHRHFSEAPWHWRDIASRLAHNRVHAREVLGARWVYLREKLIYE